MGLFRKKRTIRHLGQVGLRNPLEVIPGVEPDTEARRDAKGLLQVRHVMRPKPGLYGWLAKKLKYRHDIRVNLDEVGSACWERIDGRRTLDDVAAALRRKFDLDLDEARKAVVTFIRTLMLRRLIYLKVPAPRGAVQPRN